MSKLAEAKKLDLTTSIALSPFDNRVNDVDRLPDDVLKKRQGTNAKVYIKNGVSRLKYQCFEFEEEDSDGNLIQKSDSMLKIPGECIKLFEGSYIKDVDKTVADYIFKKIVGYNPYFSCACIILMDTNSDVVDIVQYRPSKDGYENLPKYLQEKSQNKPKNRGNAFLYPFQIEMERLMKKEQYAILGEGLKNALNALIRSIPFISIESTSNTNNPQLIDYVNLLMAEGIKVYGAMDGDTAGKKAFQAINTNLNSPIVNLLSFDSGLDFTDYIKMENPWD